MRLASAAAGLVCLTGLAAHAAEPLHLKLDPAWVATADEGPLEGPLPVPTEPSRAKVAWLAFGADALFEVGVSVTEIGLLAFGNGLVSGGSEGGVSLWILDGLFLALHPMVDAWIIDAVARLDRTFKPGFLATLGGAYLGCLLGAGGAVLALLTLGSWPVLEIVVASLLNALIPAATAVLIEIGTTQRSPPDGPAGTHAAALASATGRPLARWAF